MSDRAVALFVLVTVAAPICAEAEPVSSLAHLRAGEALLQQHDFLRAKFEFTNAVEGDQEPTWTIVWSHIEMGRALDATGLRGLAVREYQLAIDTNDNTFGAISVAKLYLSKAPSINETSPFPTNTDEASIPRVLTRVEPRYSAEALLARLEGSVRVNAVVDREGGVMDLKVLRSLGMGLDEAALEAVAKWTFAPATANGEPVIDGVPVDVRFVPPPSMAGWHVTRIQFAKADAASAPVLLRGGQFNSGKMAADLAEEADLDAAIGRKPTATISMEIDTVGNPGKMKVEAASLPEWGDDAIRTIGEWRFAPAALDGVAVGVRCLVDLAWYPSQ